MTRIAGRPQTASQRAVDRFPKVQHIQRMNGGGGVVFATGTPIANSVAEMFTMQRFLQMATLQAQGLAHFDSWAATFGEPATAIQTQPPPARAAPVNQRHSNSALSCRSAALGLCVIGHLNMG